VPDVAPDFVGALRVLHAREVEFIVIGGVSAVLHGAPISTLDLDIVHARSVENCRRLADALSELDARYRERPDLSLRPDAKRLTSPGHHLLITRAGPLDVLGRVKDGRGFKELLPRSVILEIDDGVSIHVVDLPTLIELKESMGTERDLAVLPILRRTLEEQRGKG
jgi:predicted nucleotidyltransferase